MTPPWCHGDVMDLTPFVEQLRRELALAAAAGGEEARALAERLTAPLESSVRLALLSALSAAAEELTGQLAPGSVDVRLRGGDSGVGVPPTPRAGPPPRPPGGGAAAPPASPPPRRRPRSRTPPRLPRRSSPRPTTAARSASPSGCPSRSRSASRRPPPASARRSTPGWCGPSPPRAPAATPPGPPSRGGPGGPPASPTPAGSASRTPHTPHTNPPPPRRGPARRRRG